MNRRPLSPRDTRRFAPWILDPQTGELTSYGERVAEERHDGRLWGRDEDDGDHRFDPMGPDFLPGTNVIGP